MQIDNLAASKRGHRTQAQRREHTKNALLDATIDCLNELGYARTSVQEICIRAGVSKGAQQHHFANKAELMAAAIEHLTHRIGAEIVSTEGAIVTDEIMIERGIELIWKGFSGALSAAALELWIAARTDPELQAAMRPVDRALGKSTMQIFAQLAGQRPSPQMESLYWLTVNLIRGLALDAEIGGDPTRRAQLLTEWKRIVTLVYTQDANGASNAG